MLEVLEKCFPSRMVEWEGKIKEMIPSYGISLTENPRLFQDLHTSTGRTLGLNEKKQFIINEEIKTSDTFGRFSLLEIIFFNIILCKYNSLWQYDNSVSFCLIIISLNGVWLYFHFSNSFYFEAIPYF